MKPKIFISSTCYDLIDLRAELEIELRNLGLIPILSDSITSEFEVSGTTHSIESCLLNVRNCDYYVIILSQRYGPSLKDVGFGDVSATHLEYLEAKKANKPIYMYIRNQFEVEHHLFTRSDNNKKVLKFVQKDNCEKMFELYSSHKQLTANSNESNWISGFKDSLELKALIRRDLKQVSGVAIISKMVKEGKSPLLSVSAANSNRYPLTNVLQIGLEIKNYGTAPALDPVLTIDLCDIDKIDDFVMPFRRDNVTKLNSISQNERESFSIQLNIKKEDLLKNALFFICDIDHTTIEGYRISDRLILMLFWKDADVASNLYVASFKAKRFVNSDGYSISTKE